jgi:hypothetical protein
MSYTRNSLGARRDTGKPRPRLLPQTRLRPQGLAVQAHAPIGAIPLSDLPQWLLQTKKPSRKRGLSVMLLSVAGQQDSYVL